MIEAAFELFTLKKLSFARFDFPRWQAVASIFLIGTLAGLDPSMRKGTSGMPVMPLGVAWVLGIMSVWIGFLFIVGFLKWWLKRGGRWNGQGDLFNLVAASWLVADTLIFGLTVFGIPGFFTLPLWLYSIKVGVDALNGAIPKASSGYTLGGIVLSLILAIIIAGAAMSVAVILLAGVGVIKP